MPIPNYREQVRFLLGQQEIKIGINNPNITLLEYLRLTARLTGTKEGCAEGDCGACTVLIGEIHQGNIRYQPINACITLLGMVDNKQVHTVETLAQDNVHPAQALMAEQHASQCGYCTPGFVMSIAALQCDLGDKSQTKVGASKAQIDDYLSGNLCRCTGYGPIINAAQEISKKPLSSAWQTQAQTAKKTIHEWMNDPRPLRCVGNKAIFVAPNSLDTLHDALLKHPDATLLGGATDVGLWITKLGKRLTNIIYLGQVSEMRNVSQTEDTLEIGAGVSLQDTQLLLGSLTPDLEHLMRRFGARQVRSQGTVGGNIANGSPIGDLPPALIALGAKLEIAGADGIRQIPLENFFIGYGKQDLSPGEFVRLIRIPINRNLHFRCWKISKRFDQDISSLMGAFSATVENNKFQDVRICFGGMAGTPKRASACEAVLLQQSVASDVLVHAKRALARDFEPITDMRASAEYRNYVAQNLLEKFILSINDKDQSILHKDTVWTTPAIHQ
ncbi:MAG: xanthine dehydrogenase small subunit [Acidiferrobacteraceae bacterium]|nr:xanthine dehydrogenase small subunit [Acidiferrobacteraceae bacterium]